MPDLLTAALATEGLIWIVLGTFVAGMVRGFAGFGTGMIYLPVASQFLGPIEAMVSMVIVDSLGPLVALPRAAREADWPDLRRLTLGMLLFMPLGIALLLSVPEEVFRFAVSIISMLLLIALVFGLRYQGRLSGRKVFGVGGASGILGGAVGLPGPPVILFYMASTHAPSVIRATTLIFLFVFEIFLLVMFALKGVLTATGLMIGAVLAVPMVLGTLIGTWLFHPDYEKVYRAAAYVIIGISALRGMPVWG